MKKWFRKSAPCVPPKDSKNHKDENALAADIHPLVVPSNPLPLNLLPSTPLPSTPFNQSSFGTLNGSPETELIKDSDELLILDSPSPTPSRFKTSYSASSIKMTSICTSPSDFEKIRMIGKGDVGKVYLVRDKLGDFYAMKVLSKSEMLKRKKVRRVLAEQEILATANHPFIVTLYHSFQTCQHLYFITEYCRGGEFFRALQKLPTKCLTETQARFYAAEALCALEFLHLMGYIYRDLKPENILLHHSGHIMLTDFDLSKPSHFPGKPTMLKSFGLAGLVKGHFKGYVVDTQSCTSGIRANSLVGTEEYISPEIIQGTGHSSAVDWWTLGILIYEMLYASTPFKGRDRNDTFNKILNDDFGLPDSPLGPISNSCKSLIRKLLIKDPYKRLGSRAGAADVKSHSFFKSLNFALLRHLVPPILPECRDPLTSNIHKKFSMDSLDLGSEVLSICESEGDDPFKHFESVTLHHLSSPLALSSPPLSPTA